VVILLADAEYWELRHPTALREIQRLSPEDLEAAPLTNPIRRARYEAGLSQADLAVRMGVTAGMLSRMEREGRRLRATTVARAQ
jgi:ribosome-binding protein aMBF1 (putative translation factor)